MALDAVLKKVESQRKYSLQPAPHALLESDQRRLLRALENFEAPYLEEKLLSERVFQSKDEYQEAFTEFKKYASLAKLYGRDLGMTSKTVDAVWHQFILFTPQYHEFCNTFIGEYLHHVTKTSFTPTSKDDKARLVDAYTSIFGDLPEIWKTSRASGTSCTNGGSGDCVACKE